MLEFFQEVLRFFWPRGLVLLIAGIFITSLVGYAYHRWVFHGIAFTRRREDGKKVIKYLFIPWKAAFEKHAWHHHYVYPSPTEPGIETRPFQQSKLFYNKRKEDAPHKFGREPSFNRTFDYVEYLLSKIGIPVGLDWVIGSTGWAILVYYVIGDPVAYVWFFLGGLGVGLTNHYMHDSFHIIPHDRLSELPLRLWLKPDVVHANLGAHLPLYKHYYKIIYRWHVAHHYDALPVEASNVSYMNVFPNGAVTNHAIITPISDLLLLTFSNERYEETR